MDSQESELSRLANSEDGPISHKINDARLLQNLRATILGFWPNRKNNHFPAPLPVSLERKNFYKLKQYQYLICVKSDGMRFLMMCYDGKVYMVDRAFKFYQIKQNFDRVIYGSVTKDTCGAIFDGELIKDEKGSWVYIIHDCVSMSGKDISQEHFDERYVAVNEALQDFWSYDEKLCDFKISTKRFYKFSEIETLKKNLESLDHSIDGLIFTPITLAIGTQTQYTLFKWKPREHHTFDFKVSETRDAYNAFVSQGQSDAIFASVEKRTPAGKTFTELLKKKCPTFKNSDIIECEYNEKTECFDPFMIRTDKSHPNSLYTVEKTMCNIKENITMEELFNLKKNN
jgi:mRNA guanylyltransferase